jgi:diguanylate cyclase (GGDEF)-like protein
MNEGPTRPFPTSEGKSESILARVSQQLSKLEKRDWELWLIVSGTGILVGAGLLVVLYPAAILHERSIHLSLDVSPQLFVGLLALLILFNTYVISRRVQLRRTRQEVISTAIQNELLRLQSFTDPLTEVYNRRSLDEMAKRYMCRASRLGTPLTLMVADLDDFKTINTKFGHLTGDFVIAEVAAILSCAVRGSDAVVRYGGDEFLVFLADSSKAGAEIVVSRITRAVEDWNQGGHLRDYTLRISLGMDEWHEGESLDSLLTRADQRMYELKERGKASSR